MVPAVIDVCRRQVVHCSSPRSMTKYARSPPQVGHRKPSGHLVWNRNCQHARSSRNRFQKLEQQIENFRKQIGQGGGERSVFPAGVRQPGSLGGLR